MDSLEKTLKQNAELACPQCEVWIDEKDLEEGSCDVCGDNLETQDRYAKLNVVLEELGKVAQQIRDMLYLTRVRCQNCAGSDEPYCEICAKEILGLLVDSKEKGEK